MGKSPHPRKKKSILSPEEVEAHDKLQTMHGHRKNSSDPLYRLPILLLVLSEAYVWKRRQGERADGDKDMNVHRSATNVSLHAFLRWCIHYFACTGWCNAGAFCAQQYPPSVSFAACSKEAGALCVLQPSSLAPFVKVNKLVCSGTALACGGEHKSREEEKDH